MKKQTMIRVTKDKNNPYVMLNKTFLQDENLSWKAKGVLAYLLSLPDDWQIYESELQEHGTDGLSSLRNGMKELLNNGYINRKQNRNEKGHFVGYEYQVLEIPTEMRKSNNGNSNNGKSHTTNNDLSNNNSINNNILHCLDELNNDRFISFYLKTMNQYGLKHKRINDNNFNYILKAIEILDIDVDIDDWEEKVIEHFENLPKNNDGDILPFLRACKRHLDVDVDYLARVGD